MEIKHLTRIGDCSAVIIDRAILESAQIDPETPLKLTAEGRRIVIEPVSRDEVDQQLEAAASKVEQHFSKMFQRLAE